MEDWYTRTIKYIGFKPTNVSENTLPIGLNKQPEWRGQFGYSTTINHLTQGTWFLSSEAVAYDYGAILIGDENASVHVLSEDSVMYMTTLLKLINNAPRPTTTVTLYRYKRPLMYCGRSPTHPIKNDELTSLAPMSTSLSKEFALAWSVEKPNDIKCCVYEITINADTPCILLGRLPTDAAKNNIQISQYNEYEVLLPPGVLTVKGQREETFVYENIVNRLSELGDCSSLMDLETAKEILDKEKNANSLNEQKNKLLQEYRQERTIHVYECTYMPLTLYRAPIINPMKLKNSGQNKEVHAIEAIYAKEISCPRLQLDLSKSKEFFKPTATIMGGGRKKNQPYEKRTVAELRALCISRRIKHTASMRKAELIAALRAQR